MATIALPKSLNPRKMIAHRELPSELRFDIKDRVRALTYMEESAIARNRFRSFLDNHADPHVKTSPFYNYREVVYVEDEPKLLWCPQYELFTDRTCVHISYVLKDPQMMLEAEEQQILLLHMHPPPFVLDENPQDLQVYSIRSRHVGNIHFATILSRQQDHDDTIVTIYSNLNKGQTGDAHTKDNWRAAIATLVVILDRVLHRQQPNEYVIVYAPDNTGEHPYHEKLVDVARQQYQTAL